MSIPRSETATFVRVAFVAFLLVLTGVLAQAPLGVLEAAVIAGLDPGRLANLAWVGALFSLSSALAAPSSGVLIDRHGERFAISVGAALLCSGFIVASLAGSTMQYAVGAGLLAGTGSGLMTTAPAGTLIKQNIRQSQVRAFALSTLGYSVGGTVALPVLALALDHSDWRQVYLGLATTVLLIALAAIVVLWPLRLAGRRSIVPRPLTPYQRVAEAIRLPLRSRNHSLVITASIASGAQRALVMVTLVPWLASLGHPLTTAAAALGISELFRAVGGIMLVVFPGIAAPRKIYIRACALSGLLMFVLWASASSSIALFAVMGAYGLAAGAIFPASSAVQAQIFESELAGKLFGLTSMFWGLGGFLGLGAFSLLAPLLGSGLAPLLAGTGLLIMSLLLSWLDP